MLSKEQDIAVQPKMALDDLLARCTDYDDMSLSMDAGELTALKQHISLLGSSAVAELLSLREQLAELKALEPIGQVIFGGYGSDGIREASVVCLHDQADWDNFPDGTLLFTAAKPAED
ncbi:TPA: hypothetical protein RM800_000601 [Yersinia enterocolitica]|uniref:hypothetical protein n=1 Tax=Yersinia enterocolitica TaxID=630 RepID=UPI0028766B57|nr:hypothetical protein [Yersinia enterocolitica]HDM8337251.1 hypothetical protein [Yersinia enterocolitica]HDW8040620.1 hypothetical protein [Yersinia enterocolitica]HEF7241272.1 hypothetical protein [Yersinia enterocolitica]HEM6609034.1 hypothetical protein [Yersinia enterocolitica]